MLLAVLDDHPASLDALRLARALGEELHAVSFGPADTEVLAKHGVPVVHQLTHALLDDPDAYAPEAFGEALSQLIAQLEPEGVFAAGTERGNEVMAQAAARAGLPLAANCIAVRPADGVWELTRIRGGGMLLEDAELEARVKLITVQPGTASEEPAQSVETQVRVFAPELPVELARSKVLERTTRSAGVSLATAEVIVSGGRGVGSAEGYAVLEELAELLGGAVGCSRVATNNGWRPHSDQVGLTGTKVAPKLYLACGISGATQHWVGCMDAKAILAVNTDPEAPMVTRATYAVIGDVHQVLPAVVAELRARGRP